MSFTNCGGQMNIESFLRDSPLHGWENNHSFDGMFKISAYFSSHLFIYSKENLHDHLRKGLDPKMIK